MITQKMGLFLGEKFSLRHERIVILDKIPHDVYYLGRAKPMSKYLDTYLVFNLITHLICFCLFLQVFLHLAKIKRGKITPAKQKRVKRLTQEISLTKAFYKQDQKEQKGLYYMVGPWP